MNMVQKVILAHGIKGKLSVYFREHLLGRDNVCKIMIGKKHWITVTPPGDCETGQCGGVGGYSLTIVLCGPKCGTHIDFEAYDERQLSEIINEAISDVDMINTRATQ